MPLDPTLVRGLTPISMPQPDPSAGVNQLGMMMKLQELQSGMQANQLNAQKYQQEIATSQAAERKTRLEAKENAFKNAARIIGPNGPALMGLLGKSVRDAEFSEKYGIRLEDLSLIEQQLQANPQNVTKLWQRMSGMTANEEAQHAKPPTALGQLQLARDQLDRKDPMFSIKLEEINNQIKHEQTRAPGTRVEINSSDTAETQAAKSYMADLAETRKALRNVPAQILNFEAAKEIVLSTNAKDFMGPGGDALRTAASFMNNRFGASINVEGVTDAGELKSRLFRGILDNLKKLDSNPTEQQQKALQEAIGSLGADPLALPRILDTFIEASRAQVDLYNEDVKSAEERGIKFPFNPYIKLPPLASSSGVPPSPSGVTGGGTPKQITEGTIAYGPDGRQIIVRGGEWHWMN